MPKCLVNGTELHYHTTGKGVPVIFIHPPLLTSSIFNYQVPELSQYCRVITFDIRGHGQSAPSAQPLTYDLIVEDMNQLLNYLNIDQAYICGYSTGGSIALHAMLQHPNRFLGAMLLSAMPEVSDWWLKLKLTAATQFMKVRMNKLMNLGISWGNKDSYFTFKKLFNTAKHGHSRNIMQYYAYSKTYSCTNQLPRIKQPVLLVYGQKDRGFYRYAEIMHHLLPASSLYFMRDVSHQLPTKAGDRLNRLLLYWLSVQEAAKKTDTAENLKRQDKERIASLIALGKEWNEQEHIHRQPDI